MRLGERTFALITFRKVGLLRFLGHLDVVRAYDRAVRRAKLPVVYSQGFAPHALLSFAMPLPVGVAGENELAGLVLRVEWDPRAVYKALAQQLPEELGPVGVQMLPRTKRSVFADLAAADYYADIHNVAPETWHHALRRLEAQRHWPIHRVTKSRELDLDIRPGVLALRAEGSRLWMRLSLQADKLAKPEEVLELLEAQLGCPLEAELTRRALYTARQLPFVPSL